MSDLELLNWVRGVIENRTPESDTLDYKTQLILEKGKKDPRLELAKDVSSFANRYGGFLFYGVPETRDKDGLPYPEPYDKCGMDLPFDLREQVESILLDTIEPPLPELFIRVLPFDGKTPKGLLLVHHPESWRQPHMVVGYKDARYYTRGNFQAVPMGERDIEQAYDRRRASTLRVDEFLSGRNFGEILRGASVRAIIVPHLVRSARGRMREWEFGDWLMKQNVARREGNWLPMTGGWCFEGKGFDVRIFYTGAVSANFELYRGDIGSRGFLPWAVAEPLFQYAITPACAVWRKLQFQSPVTIKLEIRGLQGHMLVSDEHWEPNPFVEDYDKPLLSECVTVREDSSTVELETALAPAILRLLDHFAEVGGLRRKRNFPEGAR